jgi:hypothetical protein
LLAMAVSEWSTGKCLITPGMLHCVSKRTKVLFLIPWEGD